MSQLYYQPKRLQEFGDLGRQGPLPRSKKAGETPKEVALPAEIAMRQRCQRDRRHDFQTLYDLVRLTNKTSYWNNLIRLEAPG